MKKKKAYHIGECNVIDVAANDFMPETWQTYAVNVIRSTSQCNYSQNVFESSLLNMVMTIDHGRRSRRGPIRFDTQCWGNKNRTDACSSDTNANKMHTPTQQIVSDFDALIWSFFFPARTLPYRTHTSTIFNNSSLYSILRLLCNQFTWHTILPMEYERRLTVTVNRAAFEWPWQPLHRMCNWHRKFHSPTFGNNYSMSTMWNCVTSIQRDTTVAERITEFYFWPFRLCLDFEYGSNVFSVRTNVWSPLITLISLYRSAASRAAWIADTQRWNKKPPARSCSIWVCLLWWWVLDVGAAH